MTSRRDFLAEASRLAAALGVSPSLLRALERLPLPPGPLLQRAIPKSGERIPVIGLGSSATFAEVARSEDVTALRAVLQTLVEGGGRVFDTAPGYGASEEVAGGLVNELGVADRMFWATKVNVAGRRGGTADPAAARAQIEQSLARLRRPSIDLIQVHNMGDPATQLPIVREFQRAGKVRYVGISTTFPNQYAQLIEVMRNEPLDFIGVDYAADNRDVEEVILPLAIERKIAVLAYAPFGRTSLFRRVAGQQLPTFAAEFDASTWAQFFLKFTLSHPAITAVTPATSQAKNMLDNLGGGVGRLPTAEHRRQIIAFIDALPAPAPTPRRGGTR